MSRFTVRRFVLSTLAVTMAPTVGGAGGLLLVRSVANGYVDYTIG